MDLLFLAIPRFDVQSSLFIDRLISRTTKSGFSENIRFGDVTSIIEDNSLAFAVDVTDPSVIPVSPYWRMVVLDEYTGEGFKLSQQYRRQLNGYSVPRTRANSEKFAPEQRLRVETACRARARIRRRRDALDGGHSPLLSHQFGAERLRRYLGAVDAIGRSGAL